MGNIQIKRKHVWRKYSTEGTVMLMASSWQACNFPQSPFTNYLSNFNCHWSSGVLINWSIIGINLLVPFFQRRYQGRVVSTSLSKPRTYRRPTQLQAQFYLGQTVFYCDHTCFRVTFRPQHSIICITSVLLYQLPTS